MTTNTTKPTTFKKLKKKLLKNPKVKEEYEKLKCKHKEVSYDGICKCGKDFLEPKKSWLKVSNCGFPTEQHLIEPMKQFIGFGNQGFNEIIVKLNELVEALNKLRREA